MEQVKLKVDIKGLRREANVGLVRAAAMVDVSPSTLERVEAGWSPGIVTALKVARFMQMPVEEIWGIDE
jgi:DNA-binding XRE family transcriptional regulator